jgi:hypothetical protein
MRRTAQLAPTSAPLLPLLALLLHLALPVALPRAPFAPTHLPQPVLGAPRGLSPNAWCE